MPPKMDDTFVEGQTLGTQNDDDGENKEASTASHSPLSESELPSVSSSTPLPPTSKTAHSSPTRSPPRKFNSLPELPAFPKEDQALRPRRLNSRGVSMSGIDLRNISPNRSAQGPDDIVVTGGSLSNLGDCSLSSQSAELAQKLERSREALSATIGGFRSTRTLNNNPRRSGLEKGRISRSAVNLGQRRERYVPEVPLPLTSSRPGDSLPQRPAPERQVSERRTNLQRVNEEEEQQPQALCDNAPPVPGAYNVLPEEEEGESTTLGVQTNEPPRSPTERESTIANPNSLAGIDSGGLLVKAVLVGEEDIENGGDLEGKAAAFEERKRQLEEREQRLKAWENSLQREQDELNQLRRDLGIDTKGRVKVVQAEVLKPSTNKASRFRRGLFGSLNSSAETSYASTSRTFLDTTTKGDNDDDESTRLDSFKMPATMAQIRDDLSNVLGEDAAAAHIHAQVEFAPPTPGMIRFSRTGDSSVDLSRASILSKSNKRVLKDLLQRFEEEWSATYAELLENDANTRPLTEIAILLEDSISVLDRRYRLQVYRNCFVGKEAVDFLVRSQLATSRQDAVTIGIRLQKEMHLFEHVTQDHEFKDEDLFYRFIDPSRRTTGGGAGVKGGDKSQQSLNVINSPSSTPDGGSSSWSLDVLAEKLQKSVLVKDRRYHFKTYRNVFVASEAVDFMVQRGVAATRGDAVVLGRRLQTEKKFWRHVVDADKQFDDDYLFFQFQTEHAAATAGNNAEGNSMLSPSAMSQASDSFAPQPNNGRLTSPTNSIKDEKEVVLPSVERLLVIGRLLRGGLKLTTKTHLMKKYHNCFLASDAVDFVLRADLAASRDEATELCQAMSHEHLDIWRVLGSPNHFVFRDEHLWRYFTDGNINTSGQVVDSTRNITESVLETAASVSTALVAPKSIATNEEKPTVVRPVLKEKVGRDASVASLGTLQSDSSSTGTSTTLQGTSIKWTLAQMAEKLRHSLHVKNRRYRFKVYKDCFVASDAVDFMIGAQMAKTRSEAVNLGRQLEQEYELWHHVTKDHVFQDDFLYFRFSKDKRLLRVFDRADSFSDGVSSIVDSIDCPSAARSDSNRSQGLSYLQDVADQFRQGVNVGARTWRMKKYNKVFVGCEAVDFLVQSRLAPSREEAVDLGRRLESELGLFAHVTQGHAFKDEFFFYRFQGENAQEDLEASESCGGASWENTSMTSFTLDSSMRSLCTTGGGKNGSTLDTIAKALRSNVQVKNRVYHLREYKNCFVGSEAVDYLVRSGHAHTRQDAVHLVQQFMRPPMDLIAHVCGDHEFQDDYLFYKFKKKAHRDSTIAEIEGVIERLQRF